MISNITTKIELDVLTGSEIEKAISYVAQHVIPAIVVPPSLLEQVIMERIKSKCQFKIICPIDWPTNAHGGGTQFASAKLRGVTAEMLRADGFEIMMTGGRTQAENLQEIRELGNLFGSHMRGKDCRFVLGSSTRNIAEVIQMASVMKEIPNAALVRIDHNCKFPMSKDDHLKMIDEIRAVFGGPIKICGNLIDASAITSIANANSNVSYGVTVSQFGSILRGLR